MANYDLEMSGANIKAAISNAFNQLTANGLNLADRVLTSSGNKVSVSSITTGELGTLAGINENVKASIDLLKPAFGSGYFEQSTPVYVTSAGVQFKYNGYVSSNLTIESPDNKFKATILKAGCYKVGYFASYNPSATTTISAVVKKNGVDTHIGSSGSVETNKPRSVCVESKLNLAVNDYIELFLSSGANVTLTHTHGGFNLEYLGPIGTVV